MPDALVTPLVIMAWLGIGLACLSIVTVIISLAIGVWIGLKETDRPGRPVTRRRRF